MIVSAKNICGQHWHTGALMAYRVQARYNPEARDAQGRYIIEVDGKPVRWYATEDAARRCVRRARVNGYGYSFGECA